MQSLIVLCAVLGLTAATAGPALLSSGHGWGAPLVAAAPLALGHGGVSAYSSHISHPATIHGGLLAAPVAYSHAAPLAISHGVRAIAAPAVLSHGALLGGHGLAGPALIGGHGIATSTVYRSHGPVVALGHGGLSGKIW